MKKTYIIPQTIVVKTSLSHGLLAGSFGMNKNEAETQTKKGADDDTYYDTLSRGLSWDEE